MKNLVTVLIYKVGLQDMNMLSTVACSSISPVRKSRKHYRFRLPSCLSISCNLIVFFPSLYLYTSNTMAAHGEDDNRVRETYRADYGLQPRQLL